ncbi:MAG: reverse transcriptase family protein [Propionibacteriaceae bacterium]
MLTPGRADRIVAERLAEALLFGDWEPATLAWTVRTMLGGHQWWMTDLADELCLLFAEKPSGRVAELTDVIAYSTAFQGGADDARRGGAPLRVVPLAPGARPPDGVATIPAAWGLPAIRDAVELAAWLELSLGQLLWLADPGGYQLRTGPGPLHPYGYRWVTRGGRPPRLLEAPRPILKRVQRELLDRLLARLPVHEAAHGFVAGRSVLTGVRHHLGAQVVLTVDLQDFFASVGRGRLFGILRHAGYGESVAQLLASLGTTSTPGWVLRTMPAGGSDQDRYRLRRRLRQPHLPQGASTSPALANLACFHLDRRLTGWAAAVGATYTRYADDLTFSGDARFNVASTSGVLRGIGRIVRDEGFAVNPSKTRVQGRGQRQVVTGVVVNERPNVTRRQYDQLRAVLHEARTRGPTVANRSGHPDFRSHLAGRVAWVESLNPGRGRRLRADFDAIVWTG